MCWRRFGYLGEGERVPVTLDLGALVGLDGLLDPQLVQSKLAGDGVELSFGGLVEVDPGETAVLAADLVDFFEGMRRAPTPVHGDGAIDDHGSITRPLVGAFLPLPSEKEVGDRVDVVDECRRGPRPLCTPDLVG